MTNWMWTVKFWFLTQFSAFYLVNGMDCPQKSMWMFGALADTIFSLHSSLLAATKFSLVLHSALSKLVQDSMLARIFYLDRSQKEWTQFFLSCATQKPKKWHPHQSIL